MNGLTASLWALMWLSAAVFVVTCAVMCYRQFRADLAVWRLRWQLRRSHPVELVERKVKR